MVDLSFGKLKLIYREAIIISFLAAITTVVPAPASKPCLLGYYAHCSLTPVSTVICLAIAGVLYWIGIRRSRPGKMN